LIHSLADAVEDVEAYRDEQEFVFASGALRVIHTPGHTPGSVCLYGARDRVLFVGDALQRRGGKIGFASALYSDDRRAAERAVKRLAELDVEVVVFSHYPPVLEGANEALRELAGRVRD
jgi:hydroxyacylglutathione hydrolase